MPKIAVVTDTHFGVRNDDTIFGKYISDFFLEVFFPYIDAHNIEYIIHGGDIVDKRKNINFLTARTLHVSFIEQIASRPNLKAKLLIGNHDVYFKNSNYINAIRELYGDRIPDNIEFIENVKTVNVGGVDIDMYGWINQENIGDALALMEDPKSNIAFGHFEFAGFEMQKGQLMMHGMDHEKLAKYDFVGSGHYHEKSHRDNVHYFGCPYQLTWADYGQPRGFHIFDTNTLELKHIINPLTMFNKVVYNDAEFSLDDMVKAINKKKLKDSIVKIIVESASNNKDFNTFKREIDDCSPRTVQIIEDTKTFELQEIDVMPGEDTLAILLNYAAVAETKKKDKLASVLTNLYNRALAEQISE